MTDYFALLQQPRQPWLDLEELKKSYQALALAEHPDQTSSGAAGMNFAEVNEAYRCLKDPKLRLQHLLTLERGEAIANATVPEELFEMFSRISSFIQTSDSLVQRASATENALTKSLLRSELLGARDEARTLLDSLRGLHEEATFEAKALTNSWRIDLEPVARLYLTFAYLCRWIQQVEERRFQLST